MATRAHPPDFLDVDRALIDGARLEDIAEIALAFARRARSIPEIPARHLKALLEADLARDRSAPALDRNIGRVASLLEDTGELITGDEYDDARREAKQRGESWPSRQQLCRAYGPWWRVVLTAARWLRKGPRTRVTRSNAYRTVHVPAYEAVEVLDAVIACARFIEAWPSQWIYLEWAAARRAAARANPNVAIPRLPTAKAIRRHYRDWSRLHADARERLRELSTASS
jgi:hypothetical protein